MKIDYIASYIGHGFEQGDGIKLTINSVGEIVIEASFECGHVGDTMTLDLNELIVAHARLKEQSKKE